MKKYISILALVLLTGCSLFPKKDVIITDREVRINPAALAPCADLILLPEDGNFDTVLSVTIANAELFLDCKKKQNNSIILLKQFSNTKKDTIP
jgi:hypothetical protein